MQLAFSVVSVMSLFFTLPSFAQQPYSFEDACRNAGWTTGPCAPKAKQEQAMYCVPIGSTAFHPKEASANCAAMAISPVWDLEIFVELLGLPNINILNAMRVTIGTTPGEQNAFAQLYYECKCSVPQPRKMKKGARLIFYDPQWAKTAPAEFYLTLGHEIGHHLCGHVREEEEDETMLQANELEADRFSGAAIRNFEIYHGKPFLADALKAASRLFPESRRPSHPARAARIEAMKTGYHSGSPCGNLARAIRGYTRQPR